MMHVILHFELILVICVLPVVPRLVSLTSLTVAVVKNLELALIPATIQGLKVTALLDSSVLF